MRVPFIAQVVVAGVVGFGGVMAVAPEVGSSIVSNVTAGSNCNIKGNVSINTGERIYHVPGQMFYDDTRIRPEYGERWFCSEAEARAAGWRKARR